VTVEEPPQRADSDRRAPLSQQCLQLDQCDVVLCLDRTEHEGRVRLDPGRTTIAALRFGCRGSVLKNQLPPADRARCAYPEAHRCSPA